MGVGDHLLWATDVHFDHAGGAEAAADFGASLRRLHHDSAGLVLTGDIAGARDIVDCLEELKRGWGQQVYFVLGNHDYYRGRFRIVDDQVGRATNGSLIWLRQGGQLLGPQLAIAGTDGWYDARYGDPDSPLQLSDFMQIADIFEALDGSRAEMHALIQRRADALAGEMESNVTSMLQKSYLSEVLIGVHVPPFVESCFYKGETANGTYAPYFASKATGDALLRLAEAHPQVRFTVLCGHGHHEGRYQALENLNVYTGRAEYGSPRLAGIVQLSPRISVDLYRS